jgi:pimeloyl-ACP methyl ester carboxylesterase
MDVQEGTFTGGLPYLVLGSGEPLVYLCGFTLDHRNPRPGFERGLTLRTLTPLARAGFQVYFTNRWPGMAPGTTFAEVAERHAEAIRDHFGKPVDVLGASTGGSLALQLIADRPDVVRKAVVACAAYTLGPLAKEVQLKLLHSISETGRYPAEAVLDSLPAKLRSRWLRALVTPVALLAAKRSRSRIRRTRLRCCAPRTPSTFMMDSSTFRRRHWWSAVHRTRSGHLRCLLRQRVGYRAEG